MANGVIDGNVLAALITLVALGMAATFIRANSTHAIVQKMDMKVDLLWKISPYENPHKYDRPRNARRPRRR